MKILIIGDQVDVFQIINVEGKEDAQNMDGAMVLQTANKLIVADDLIIFIQ